MAAYFDNKTDSKHVVASMIAFLMLLLTVESSTACDTQKASAGGPGLNLTLIPGVPQTVEWDFTDCIYSDGNHLRIVDMRIYVTKQRGINGYQKSLPPLTPLSISAENQITGDEYAAYPNFTIDIGEATGGKIVLTLLLDASANKPLDCAVTYTANFGG